MVPTETISSASATAAASASVSAPIGIMITNDDGPPGKYAPFFLPFTRRLKKWTLEGIDRAGSGSGSGTVSTIHPPNCFVCVPSDQQSWVGKSITRFSHCRAYRNWESSKIERVQEDENSIDLKLWSAVDGSPATTTNIGLNVLAPFPIDLVISGPNLGRNTGRSFTLSSGTVGAALESSFHSIRAIAISFAFFDHLYKYKDIDIANACEVALQIVDKLWRNWPTDIKVEIFNVNIPLGCSAIPEIYMTHLIDDYYGAIYKPIELTNSGNKRNENISSKIPHLDSISVNDQVASPPLPLPADPSLPEAQPTTTLTTTDDSTNKSMIFPIASIPQHRTAPTLPDSIQPLIHTSDMKFNLDMFTDRTSIPNYLGSDYWAVEHGHVSITPLNSELAQPKLQKPFVYRSYK